MLVKEVAVVRSTVPVVGVAVGLSTAMGRRGTATVLRVLDMVQLVEVVVGGR